MVSLLKRKPEATGIPPWHPNFRNEQKLPDVKVIRTSFFVNAAVAVFFLAALLWVVYQEYELSELRKQIAKSEEQIAQDEVASQKAVALYKDFAAEERRVKELADFMGSRPSMRDLILTLSSAVPEEIALASLEIGEEQILMRGFISGLPAKASGAASAFEKVLRDHPQLGKAYSSVTLTSIGRDAQSGRMSFSLVMKRKAPEAKPQKKGKK